jgi:hypothetical protein
MKATIDLSRAFGPLTVTVNDRTFPIVNPDGSPALAEDLRGKDILLSPCDDGIHYVIDKRTRKQRRAANAQRRKAAH